MESVFAVLGTPLHSSGGETLTPSQVYVRGIGWPSLKAVLVNLISGLSSFGVLVAGGCATGGRFAQFTDKSIKNAQIIMRELFLIDSPRLFWSAVASATPLWIK